MTPEQKIMRDILRQANYEGELTAETIEDVYWEAREEHDGVQDAEQDFREGEYETEIPADYSRHYESKSVAAKLSDGTWVGWTYWYGGGKHGEPDAIDWMNKAYELTVTEEQKMMTVRTFTKA